jgi:hypothetical protein
MVECIYYTGIGSKKNGKHSVKEFLDIMNKLFNVACSEYLPELDFEPCRQYKEMDNKMLAYNIKHNKPLFNKDGTLKTNNSKKYKKLSKQCIKYKKTQKKRKCNLEEYINFSGAEKEIKQEKEQEHKSVANNLIRQQNM